MRDPHSLHERSFDVLVIGAGIAGSVAAILSVKAGAAVLVLHDDDAPHYKIGESLPGVARAMLTKLGFSDVFERVPFLTSTGNRSSWGTGELVDRA